jgi:hypothetical protein
MAEKKSIPGTRKISDEVDILGDIDHFVGGDGVGLSLEGHFHRL